MRARFLEQVLSLDPSPTSPIARLSSLRFHHQRAQKTILGAFCMFPERTKDLLTCPLPTA